MYTKKTIKIIVRLNNDHRNILKEIKIYKYVCLQQFANCNLNCVIFASIYALKNCAKFWTGICIQLGLTYLLLLTDSFHQVGLSEKSRAALARPFGLFFKIQKGRRAYRKNTENKPTFSCFSAKIQHYDKSSLDIRLLGTANCLQ